MHKFKKKGKIDSHENQLQEIAQHEKNIGVFYHYVKATIFVDANVRYGEKFYFCVAKHYVPRISRRTLKTLGYIIGIWMVQGFDHRKKPSMSMLIKRIEREIVKSRF